MKKWLYTLSIILSCTTFIFAQNSELEIQVPFLPVDTTLSAAIENDNSTTEKTKKEKQDPLVKKFLKKAQKKAKKAFFAIAGKSVKKAFSQGKKTQKSADMWNKKLNKGGGMAIDSTFKLREGIQIFGWHPHWRRESHSGYKYEILSTISYFAYDINPNTGNYRTPEIMNDWKTTPMVTEAQAAGCNVLLSITNFGANNNKIFLDNSKAQQTTIDSLVALVEFRGGNGVDIDFEAIPVGYKAKFTAFVQRLSLTFKNKNEDYVISMALPAVDHTDAFDIPTLNEFVDIFVIMGYDYHTKGSGAGPIAPLPPKGVVGRGYDLANSVEYYLSVGIDTANLILGLPHYGTIWESDSPDFAENQYVNKMSYAEIMSTWGNQYEPTFDSLSSSYYFLVRDSVNQNYKKCWFDNERSLGMKYDFILEKKIGGAGIFALGYFDGHTGIWGTLAEKFHAEEEEEADFSLAGHFRRNHQAYITAVLFIICFASLGVVFGLKDEKHRIQIIGNQLFQSFFISIFTGLLIALLMLFDWFNIQSLILLLGLLGGFIIGLSKLKLPNFKRRYIP